MQILLIILLGLVPWCVQAQNGALVGAEYFIDQDPGQGQATALSGSFSGQTSELEFDIDTAGLAPGSHVAYIRFQDEDGNWGRVKSAAFQISVPAEDLETTIIGAEYFIDIDPGAGQATALSGSFSGQTSELEFDIDTAGLAPGSHVAYIRFQDEDGVWGRVKSVPFQISVPAEDLVTRITGAEYFIDIDPGEGQAILLKAITAGIPLKPSLPWIPPISHRARMWLISASRMRTGSGAG